MGEVETPLTRNDKRTQTHCQYKKSLKGGEEDVGDCIRHCQNSCGCGAHCAAGYGLKG